MRQFDQAKQRGVTAARGRQAQVEHLLDAPCGFAKSCQADHPAAAFQCMKSATQCRQVFLVMRRAARCRQRCADRFEHLDRFCQKDFQQLGVDRVLIIDRRG